MRLLQSTCVLFLMAVNDIALFGERQTVHAKKYSSSGRPPPSRRSSASSSKPRKVASSGPPRRPRYVEDEDDDDNEGDEDIEEGGFDELEDDFDEEEDEDEDYRPRKPSSRARSPATSSRGGRSKPSSGRSTSRSASRSHSNDRRPSRRYEDEEDEYYEEDYPPRQSRSGRPSKSSSSRSRPPPRGGRVVQYRRPQQPSAFTRSLNAIRESIPDASTMREAAVGSIKAARETSSKLTANIYREVKGLTSSELEQVMLKVTRPDDSAAKDKHVERLVGLTYAVSPRYDIYGGILRKLWAKMAEKDWRTTIKALYVLHRFSADGAPQHQAQLKARLRELRRTRDPKRKDKYFNKEQLLSGIETPENEKYRGFMARYAHYVLFRAQSFGGMFDEISTEPRKSKKAPKPITSTSLGQENLDAAKIVLKAGLGCQLKPGEDSLNTAFCAERVASDLIGLSSAVGLALNRALKGDDLAGADPALIKAWCEFYSDDLLPKTREMVKRTAPKLDAHGLYLSSRMGTTVSPEVLQKGLKAVAAQEEANDNEEDVEEEELEEPVKSVGEAEDVDEDAAPNARPETEEAEPNEEEEGEDEEDAMEDDADVVEEDEYDEYDEEEEYYDDEEE